MMNPIDILLDPISLIVLAIYGGLMIWEAIFPGRQLPPIRNWKIRGLASFFFFFYLSTYLPMFWDAFFSHFQIFNVEFLGTIGGALVAVMVYELGVYFWHRAMHRSDRLWTMFHQMHHSAERLDSYGAFYFSPWDMVGWTLLGSICMVMIVGLTPQAATLALLTTTFLGMFQHTNIRTPQWLGYLIQRPESHTVHHARGIHAFNYSDLPIYDILFGTFKNPSSYEYDTGFYDGASKRVWDMIQGKDVEREQSAKKELKILISVAILFFGVQLSNAQTINYQGAFRSTTGEIMSNHETDVRISFFENNEKVYEETHENIQTNNVGIFSLRIGSINVAAFQNLDFSRDLEMQTEIRSASGYEIASYENFSAVPMAMHAKTVDDADDADADPTNELQLLSFDPATNILSLSDGDSIDLSSLDSDVGGSGTGTDNQQLSISGTQLSIEDGNSVNLSALRDGVEDDDSDPENEIQKLTREGNRIKLSANGGEVVDAVEDADADPENEIQKLSLNVNSKKLSISRGGGSVDLTPVLSANSNSYWVKDGQKLKYEHDVLLGSDLSVADELKIGKRLLIKDVVISSEDALFLQTPVGADLVLNTGSAGAIRIGDDVETVIAEDRGRVGIGTRNLTAKLTVSGNGVGGAIRVEQASNALVIGGDYIQGHFGSSQTGKLKLNVGGGQLYLGKTNSNLEDLAAVNINNAGGGIGLQIAKGRSASLSSSGGYLVMGQTSGPNLVFDENEIQARNNGQPASLILNKSGGRLHAGGLRDIGNKADMKYDIESGEIGYDNSSRRYKSNISSLHDDWKKILKARPVTYDRPASPGDWEYGYVAEEMDSIGLSNLVFYDAEGRPDNVDYARMVLYLTEVIKMHERRDEQFQSLNKMLESRIANLETKLAELSFFDK